MDGVLDPSAARQTGASTAPVGAPAGSPRAARSGELREQTALPVRSDELGAHHDGSGTSFSLVSQTASAVNVVLVDSHGAISGEWRLLPGANNVWSGYVPGVGPGQRYNFRVDGDFAPGRGVRHNPRRLLLDPRGRAMTGEVTWGPELFDYDTSVSTDVVSPLITPAGAVPHSLVVSEATPDTGVRPAIAPQDRVIYEAHVRGLTKQNPAVAHEERGGYLGVGSPAMISHLRRIGVTTVELLPVQAFLSRPELLQKGLSQYWGYDTVGFFAPHPGYASNSVPGVEVGEFREMVRRLHAAGIEVILDVVFNHTPEGGEGGPSLCLRGVDNAAAYALDPRDPRRYVDMTGCGNTVNLAHPETLRMVLDSLRYWVSEMGVDGFRFDEASALARRGEDFDSWSAFLVSLNADPVLRRVQLIAEPWNVGHDPYQLGNFPAGWAEWNGRFRDTVRDFWRGTPGIDDLARRVAGSSDLFSRDRRGPMASVNFVTVHDGFTMRDMVSYNEKHNWANGEQNRDGVDDNRSWNRGVEGDTTDVTIVEERRRAMRNMIATLFLSQGQPMLLAGDELARTQQGNNNPYNQDNPISWVDWNSVDGELTDFVSRMAALRREQPVLRRTTFLDPADCRWVAPDDSTIGASEWADHSRQSLGLLLDGERTGELHPDGTPVTGDSLLMIFHGGPRDLAWQLPQDGDWEVLVDSAAPTEVAAARCLAAGARLSVSSRSVVVLRRREVSQPAPVPHGA